MLGRLVRSCVGVSMIVVAVAACGGVDGPAKDGQSRADPPAQADPPGHADPPARADSTLTEPPSRPADVRVQVGERALTPPLRGGFVGISIEVPALTAYAGEDPKAVNPVFEQLLRNLAPGQQPVLRIGGDSTDVSWIPARGVPRIRGVTYTISRRWLAVAHALAKSLRARLILGVDLEAGSPALAAAEARGFLAAIGRRYVHALELGNESNRYPALPWYRVAHRRGVYARRRGYGFRAFELDFARAARRVPAVPLAGPTVGGFYWLSYLREFLAGEPGVRLATFHRYPLNRCFTKPWEPSYPTIGHLLSPRTTRGLVQGLAPYVALAHRRGVAFRVDELNSVACGGQVGISDTFVSALWVLDAAFSLAQAGVDGINVHTFPTAAYQLFTFRRVDGRWTASVKPEYYGLMMVAQATPAGSRVVSVQVGGTAAVRVWATTDSAGRVRVVLINVDTRSSHVASVRLSRGDGGIFTATLERLQAPAVAAVSGVRLGGQSFGRRTTTGRLAPRAQRLPPVDGAYMVGLPAGSAALLTVPGR